MKGVKKYATSPANALLVLLCRLRTTPSCDTPTERKFLSAPMNTANATCTPTAVKAITMVITTAAITNTTLATTTLVTTSQATTTATPITTITTSQRTSSPTRVASEMASTSDFSSP